MLYEPSTLASALVATSLRQDYGIDPEPLFESRDGDSVTIILDGEIISAFSTIENTFVYDTTRQPGDIDAFFDYLTDQLGDL